MLFNIEDNLYKKLLITLSDTDKKLYFELLELKPIITSIEHARNTKTNKAKQSIKETIKSLYNQNMSITKYRINKLTGISFKTLNKYFDELFQEVKNEL